MIRRNCAIAMTSVVMMLTCTRASGEVKVQQLTQYGITWTFDRPVQAGQFINGDWWVIGPVTVTSITPMPGPADAGDAIVHLILLG